MFDNVPTKKYHAGFLAPDKKEMAVKKIKLGNFFPSLFIISKESTAVPYFLSSEWEYWKENTYNFQQEILLVCCYPALALGTKN